MIDNHTAYTLRLARRLMRERISLPEAQAGSWKIVHVVLPMGSKLPIVTMREALLTGSKELSLLCADDVVIHQLQENKDVWMSDFPCELVQMWRQLAVHARGRVLVGGLGLGILPRMLELMPAVTQIVVVEKNPEVISLIAPYLSRKTEVLHGDIYEFVSDPALRYRIFRYALLDTWAETGEWAWQKEVVPLRRKIGQWIPHVYCWAEDQMRAQIAQTLFRVAGVDAKILFRPSTCHYYAFRRAVARKKILPYYAPADVQDFLKLTVMELKNQENPALQDLARLFLFHVGTPLWEKLFGEYWDEAWNIPGQNIDENSV